MGAHLSHSTVVVLDAKGNIGIVPPCQGCSSKTPGVSRSKRVFAIGREKAGAHKTEFNPDAEAS